MAINRLVTAASNLDFERRNREVSARRWPVPSGDGRALDSAVEKDLYV
jgi:hypothetical protein